MSTSDDWERWLHLGGASDAGDATGIGHDAAGDAAGAGRTDRADGSPAQPDPLEIDDPWGTLEVALTPLTDAQREYLRLAEPTLLDELVELDRSDTSGDDPTVGVEAHVPWAGELSTALDAIEDIDTIEPPDGDAPR